MTADQPNTAAAASEHGDGATVEAAGTPAGTPPGGPKLEEQLAAFAAAAPAAAPSGGNHPAASSADMLAVIPPQKKGVNPWLLPKLSGRADLREQEQMVLEAAQAKIRANGLTRRWLHEEAAASGAAEARKDAEAADGGAGTYEQASMWTGVNALMQQQQSGSGRMESYMLQDYSNQHGEADGASRGAYPSSETLAGQIAGLCRAAGPCRLGRRDCRRS
jgi:hypothetical protein